jgi:hypothetical protein
MDPAGTMIGTEATTQGGPAYATAYGVDFSAITFSQAAFKSTGFVVDGSGNVAGIKLQSTLKYSAAGTPLPTCNAGAEGTRASVSDANAPTFLGAYTSGGTVHASVYCNGTAWVTG